MIDEQDGTDSLDDELSPDDEFPLGDGSADTHGTVICPHCGETNEVALDPDSGDVQEYVEDCQVCCKPWRLQVTYGPDGTAEITAEVMD